MSEIPSIGAAFHSIPWIDRAPFLLLTPLWFFGCIYFLIRSAIFGFDRTERIDKVAKSPYLPRVIMEYGYWMFTLPIAFCLRVGLTPNMLTYLSLILTGAAAVALGMGHFSLGGWTLFIAFMCDAWDGMVARRTNTSSIGGEFLDATIDRYNDLLGFLGLMFYYRNDPLPLALATASLIGSTLVSYTRAKGEAVGVDPNVGYMQRHERAVYLGIATCIAPVVAAFVEPGVAHPQYRLVVATLALIAAGTNFTAIWRARFVLAGLRRKAGAPAPVENLAVAERSRARRRGGFVMRQFAAVKTALPGPRSQALLAREKQFLAPGIQALSQLAGIAVDHGKGALLTDLDGNTFIDFVAGICVASLGHGHPALGEALAAQANKVAAGSFASEARVELLERIARETGKIGSGALRRTQLYSGGAEAVESALRLARAHTRKHETLSFWGGFHGKTGGVLGLMGSDFKHHLGPLPSRAAPGAVSRQLSPAVRRLKYRRRRRASIILRAGDQISNDGLAGGDPAVEPIQGTNGNVLPPADFLPAVKEVAREHGALLILDEMITGWGRTGKMFGQQHYGVEADILIFGKGVASGFPVTGIVTSDEVLRAAEPWSKPSFSSSSYGGNAAGAAAANAVTRSSSRKTSSSTPRASAR